MTSSIFNERSVSEKPGTAPSLKTVLKGHLLQASKGRLTVNRTNLRADYLPINVKD